MSEPTLAVWHHLVTQPEVAAVFPAADGSTDEIDDLFVWRHHYQHPFEGYGKKALVITRPSSWTGVGIEHTWVYPRIQLEFAVDSGSGSGGADFDQIWEAWRVVDKFLHYPFGLGENWGPVGKEMLVTSSVRITEPSPFTDPDAPQQARALALYNLTMG